MNWFWILISFFSLFALGLADNMRGPIFPDLLKAYNLSDSTGSTFFVLSSVVGTITNILSIYWLPHWGIYRSLRVFLVVQIIGMVMIGLGANFSWILVGAAVFGASLGGLSIAQNVLIADVVEARHQRQIFSGLHCMYGIASLLAPLVASALYHLGWPWSYSFLLLAVLPLVLLVATYLRTQPISLRGEVLKDAPLIDKRPWGQAFWFALTLGLYVVSELVVSTRLVLYLRREKDFGVDAANVYLTIFFLLLFAGRFIFATVPFHFSNRRLMSVCALTSLFAYGIGLLFHPIGLVLCGLTMAAFFPCMMAFIAEEAPASVDFITSACLTGSAVGLIFMHFLLGKMADIWGLWTALWLGPLALVVVIALLFPRKKAVFTP